MSTITQVYVLKPMHVGLILQVFKYLLVLVCCVYASYGRLSELFLDKEWEEFKQIHNKVYSKQEENRRWVMMKHLNIHKHFRFLRLKSIFFLEK